MRLTHATHSWLPRHYNEGMIGLRYIHILALALWLGTIVTVGAIAAPATFDVLEHHNQADGRVLAGAVVAEVLHRVYVVTYLAGAALILSLAGMALIGPRPSQFAVRLGIALLMLAVTLYSGFVLLDQIETLQREIGVSVSSLPASDVRRVRFGQLHGLSTGLMLMTAAGGLALLFWAAKETVVGP